MPLTAGSFTSSSTRSISGPSSAHGDRDQLHAEALGDVEVAVIAGGRAEPLDLGLLGPGLGAVAQAVGVGLGNHVVHELEAGAAADEALLGSNAQDLGKELLCRRKAGQLAVVAGVDAVDLAVGGVAEHGEDAGDQIQLLPAGLAPGHVELELHAAEAVKFLPQRLPRAPLRARPWSFVRRRS